MLSSTSLVTSPLSSATALPAAGKVGSLLNQLTSTGKLSTQYIQGCSPAEIANIEKELGASFPNEYKYFLQLMGKGAGVLFQGTEIYYPAILELQRIGKSLLQSNDFLPLPENAFVFCMHQGYELNFFYLDDGDDPPIYQFYEGQEEREFVKSWNSFSEFLKYGIDQHLQVWPNLNP